MQNGTLVLHQMLAGNRGVAVPMDLVCNYIWEFLFLGFHGHSAVLVGKGCCVRV